MEIEDLLEEEGLWEIPEEELQRVEVLELEEYLDNLGYIDIRQNTLILEREAAAIIAGIRQFRLEYQRFYPFSQEHKDVFPFAFPPVDIEKTPTNELTEEELNFLAHLSSLEGEFGLHQFSETQIKANPILIRVLNFRLSILDLLSTDNPHLYSDGLIGQALKKWGMWTGVSLYEEQLALSGDVHELARTLVKRPDYPGSVYAHIGYFKEAEKSLPSIKETSAARRKKGAKAQKRADFEGRLIFIPEVAQAAYRKKNKDYETIMNDDLHRHMCRIVQIKLWLLGTYAGNLDSDIGPVSLQAVVDLIEFIQQLQEKVTGGEERAGGIFIEDIICQEKDDYWALNITFLLQQVFPVLIEKYTKELSGRPGTDEPDDTIKNATVAEEIHDLAEQVDEREQEAFYTELNTIIQADDGEKEKNKDRRRKVKTRGGKDFFRSVKLFFKKLATGIVNGIIKGVKAIVSAIKSLFKWIKNGIKVLIREIKKVFTLFRKAVRFVFGKKIITTRSEQASITTDYDIDFDNITRWTGVHPGVTTAHIQKNREILQALRETSDFLGVAFFIVANLGQGVLGWLRMGIRLIKQLAIQKFGFQRFSFPEIF